MKFDNDFYMFALFLTVVVSGAIIILTVWDDFKLNLNPFVLCFFYRLTLGFFWGKIRRDNEKYK